MKLTVEQIRLLFHAEETIPYHNMVDYHKPESIGLLKQNFGHLQILLARGRIAAWMIVHKNNGARRMFVSPFENFFGIDDNQVDGSNKQRLLDNQFAFDV